MSALHLQKFSGSYRNEDISSNKRYYYITRNLFGGRSGQLFEHVELDHSDDDHVDHDSGDLDYGDHGDHDDHGDHGYVNHGDPDHGESKGRESRKMKPFLGQNMYLPLPL